MARARTTPKLTEYLSSGGMKIGDPVFLRAIKEDKVLELWVKPRHSERFVMVKRYPIAKLSGALGPKQSEGDQQVPEGFYDVVPASLNPQSKYHLAFNIGYPNDYDRALGRTGSYIMIHGGDSSVGCLAMSDSGIEEIYTLVAQALMNGQKTVPVQIYPFVPTPARLVEEKNSGFYPFWKLLEKTWEWTELNRAPAPVVFENNQLVLKVEKPDAPHPSAPSETTTPTTPTGPETQPGSK